MSGSPPHFWEMLALEPGMEWLEQGLAGQGAAWRAAGSASGTDVAVAFFGALRMEEMVTKHRNVLRPELLFSCDLQLTERVAVLCLRSPHARRERLVISLGLSGEPWVCPVLALHSYLWVRPRWDGPLFVRCSSGCVMRRELVAVLRDALRWLGLRAEQYGVHSWLGTAVTTLRCGYSHERATRLARWPCGLPRRLRPVGPAAKLKLRS